MGKRPFSITNKSNGRTGNINQGHCYFRVNTKSGDEQIY